MAEPSTLALFWAGVIAVSILIYVILDGFDLGVGILSGFVGDEGSRDKMVESIAPVWDGNETWLIVIGASLFAAFPPVYSVFLGAFYLPVLLMLAGLIFRGLAFEFREHSHQKKWLWDIGFCAGSLVTAFVQGAAVGALMRGLPVKDGQFAGGSFDWLHPFPILTGIGLVIGYALLGGGWLIMKSEGFLRIWAGRQTYRLAYGLLVVLGLALLAAMTVDISDGLVEAASRVDAPAMLIAGLCGVALVGVAMTAKGHRERLPFFLTVLAFLAAFAVLGKLMWPYMIPYALTVESAAAPEESLSFFFAGSVFVLPLILAYSVGTYWVFRGKSGG